MIHRTPLEIGDGFINRYNHVFVITGKVNGMFVWFCPSGQIVRDPCHFREDYFGGITWF